LAHGKRYDAPAVKLPPKGFRLAAGGDVGEPGFVGENSDEVIVDLTAIPVATDL